MDYLSLSLVLVYFTLHPHPYSHCIPCDRSLYLSLFFFVYINPPTHPASFALYFLCTQYKLSRSVSSITLALFLFLWLTVCSTPKIPHVLAHVVLLRPTHSLTTQSVAFSLSLFLFVFRSHKYTISLILTLTYLDGHSTHTFTSLLSMPPCGIVHACVVKEKEGGRERVIFLFLCHREETTRAMYECVLPSASFYTKGNGYVRNTFYRWLQRHSILPDYYAKKGFVYGSWKNNLSNWS